MASRRRLPPSGDRRYERDLDGRLYVYRLTAGRAVLTPARGANPGPGDRILDARTGRVSQVGPRGGMRRLPSTPATDAAVARMRAGAGVVVRLGRTAPSSPAARRAQQELDARSGGLPPPTMPRRERVGELAASLGIDPRDLASRQSGEFMRSGVLDVLTRASQFVGRAELTSRDVFAGAAERSLYRDLQGVPEGLRARLDPARRYFVSAHLRILTTAGEWSVHQAAAGPATPGELPGALASLLMVTVGGAVGLQVSSGRGRGGGGGGLGPTPPDEPEEVDELADAGERLSEEPIPEAEQVDTVLWTLDVYAAE